MGILPIEWQERTGELQHIAFGKIHRNYNEIFRKRD